MPLSLNRALPRSALLVLATFLTHSSTAQILMSGGTYTQDFNSLSISGASNPWTNNGTLVGWYASKESSPTDFTSYRAGSGTIDTGGLYSFGSQGDADRALGSLASVTPGRIAFGARFLNDTGTARTNIALSFTAEQWRNGAALVEPLQFFYRVGVNQTNSDARNQLSWTHVPALDFYSPNTNALNAVNGNLAANRASFTNVVFPGLTVLAGQELFLRWLDEDSPGFDDGLAIDDLTVSFGQPVTNAPSPGTNAAFSVLTYNLKGNGAADWSTNAPQVRAIARQLIYLNPDIIAFNEIPNAHYTEMTNWMQAFLPDYTIVVSHGTDGFIRNGAASRFPIMRWTNYLDGTSLTNFNPAVTNGFTRDLFEVQIDVPGFSQPLHLFVVHLKSGTDDSYDAARRAAEASAVSNYFVTGFLTTNALHPYLLVGDMNEDIFQPATGSQHPIQRLINGTGLQLTTPLNPLSLSSLTHSIQNAAGLNRRYDYIMPNTLLAANIQSAQVFRTDLLNPMPSSLNTNDDILASDHLPVMMVFNNPFTQPFSLTSITRSNQSLSLTWESVPGQLYRVESSSDITAGWMTIADNLLATNYTAGLNTNLVDSSEFFRVKRSN